MIATNRIPQVLGKKFSKHVKEKIKYNKNIM